MRGKRSLERGVSPVVGGVLMIAIIALTVAVSGSLILGLADETDPQPDVALYLELTGDVAHTLRHENGEALQGDRTEFLGVADEDVLHGRRFEAGQTVDVVPVENEVRLVWYGQNTDHLLQTFDIDTGSLPYDVDRIDDECEWVEDNINNNGDLDMNDDAAACDVTGDTDTGATDIDIDLSTDSLLVGDIDTDGDVDVDSSKVVGNVTTDANDITITGGTSVYGDVVAQSDTNIGIDGDSSIGGDVVAEIGTVSLDSVEIDGHLYVDETDLSCTDTTIGPNEETCAEYAPKDPDEY